MNNIQKYDMTNYQVNFQAGGRKKAVKTLADVLKKHQQDKKMLYKDKKMIYKLLNKIYNYMPKLECHCNVKTSAQTAKNIHDGIIDIIR